MMCISTLYFFGLSGVLGFFFFPSEICFLEDTAGQPYLCINSLPTLLPKSDPKPELIFFKCKGNISCKSKQLFWQLCISDRPEAEVLLFG